MGVEYLEERCAEAGALFRYVQRFDIVNMEADWSGVEQDARFRNSPVSLPSSPTI